MNSIVSPSPRRRGDAAVDGYARWPWMLMVACLVLVGLGLLRHLRQEEAERAPVGVGTGAADNREARDGWFGRFSRRSSKEEPAPEVIVAGKITQFARNRLGIAESMARKANLSVPADVRRFFALVEGGRWEEIDALFQALSNRHRSEPRSPELDAIWPTLLETCGAAEQAHLWPAQKLLDYGQAVLGSLRPGMVYIGGTDPGRFIPTLLNETSEGEHHVVITQNALADNTYLEYLRFLYGERVAALDSADSQQAFKTYLADAQQRFEHDQRFPDAPKQLRPGEDVQLIENRVQVSGQVAVMAINEKLLQTFIQKNPQLSFALEESFALPSTYADATPLGPIMELRAQDPQNGLNAERAEESLRFWRATAAQLSMDPQAPDGSDARKAWAHMAMGQANLFADHNLTAAAEEAYHVAADIWSEIPEATFGLAQLLARTGRVDAANQLLDEFGRKNPEQLAAVERSRQALNSPLAPARR